MAPKKVKGNLGSSSSFDRTRFVSDAAQARYEHAKINRNPITERGFRRQREDRYVGPLVDLDRRSWEKFGAQPRAAVVSIVREFYANAGEKTDDKAFVRGKLVSFDSEIINAFLETPEVDDSTFQALVANPDYTVIIDTLCHPGAIWKPVGGSPSCFDEKYLKADNALWYLFLARRMMPVSHKSEVQKERAVVLYAISQGYPINVGKLINSQILISVNNRHIGLFFPCLISELCAMAGVVFRDDEEWLQPMKPICIQDWQRKYAKRRLEFRTDEGDTGGSSTAVPRRQQPHRRSLNEKVDETLAFMAHQERVNLNHNEHISYLESMMHTMMAHRGVDPGTIPPPPPFISPFNFQYDYQPQGNASGVPPPDNDEDE
ncbi:uncharacterized protein [Primulina eburnea]|uniref:uncharacterized protein n=1 Tax=Primulina eburnea TaxID=1245227 RepID=UPI003C6C7B42